MICTELYNGQGPGDQLWVYATTRCIALDNGYDFGIASPEKFKLRGSMDVDFGNLVVGGKSPEGGPPTELPIGIVNYYQEKKTWHPHYHDCNISKFDENLVRVPDNTKIEGIMHNLGYIDKHRQKIQQWFKVPKFTGFNVNDYCILNIRGGEYKYVPDLFLPRQYWVNAMIKMKNFKPSLKFIIVTDDEELARHWFPELEVLPRGIDLHYEILSSAKYLIISSSTFGFFPTYLNDELRACIAPKYWARHNVSDGFWCTQDELVDFYEYLDRDGKLWSYEECLEEKIKYEKDNSWLWGKE